MFDSNNHDRIAVEIAFRFGEIFYLHGTASLQDAPARRFRTGAERFALQVLDIGRIAAELRHQLESAPVVLSHEAEIGRTKAGRIVEKILENRLQLAGVTN